MLEAGRSGNQARQQSANRQENARQFDETMDQQDANRFERQWNQRRAERASREKEWTPSGKFFDQTQDLKDDDLRTAAVGQQLEQQKTAAASEQQQVDFSQQLQKDQQSLQAATAGLQAAPDPRMAALMGEMERGGEQMKQGLESTGQGRKWVPTKEAKQAQQSKQEVAMADSETKRINAVANYQRATNDFRLAEMRLSGAKTGAARAEEEAAMKEIKKQLIHPIKATTDLMRRMMNNKGTMEDWNTARAMINNGENQLAGDLEAMKASLQANEWTPRLQQFVEGKIAKDALKFILATGALPDGDLVNTASVAFQTFTKNALESRQLLGTNQLFSVRDQVEMNRYVNRFAAGLTLSGAPTGGQQQQGQQQPDPTPATPGAIDQYQASKPNEQRPDPATGAPPPGGQQPFRGDPADLPAAQPESRLGGEPSGYRDAINKTGHR